MSHESASSPAATGHGSVRRVIDLAWGGDFHRMPPVVRSRREMVSALQAAVGAARGCIGRADRDERYSIDSTNHRRFCRPSGLVLDLLGGRDGCDVRAGHDRANNDAVGLDLNGSRGLLSAEDSVSL